MPEQKVATNREARFNFHIFDKFEAGIVLLGSEVKSIREGSVSIRESFIRFDGGEAYIHNMYVKPYLYSRDGLDPTRTRKILLNKSEIEKICGRFTKKGFTCVPLSIYFNKRGRVKLEIALCQGKTRGDKRDALREKDDRREMDRALKSRKKQ